jgi:hypothetical protein
MCLHSPWNAALAALIAFSASFSPALETTHIFSSVAGLMTSNVYLSSESTNSPLMKSYVYCTFALSYIFFLLFSLF